MFYESAIGGPAARAGGQMCKSFVEENVDAQGVRTAACAVGFAAACAQGKISELDDIADHLERVHRVKQSSFQRSPQSTLIE